MTTLDDLVAGNSCSQIPAKVVALALFAGRSFAGTWARQSDRYSTRVTSAARQRWACVA